MWLPRRSPAFTLIELLVVISLIAILTAIMLPVFHSSREKARQWSCAARQRQLVLAVVLYTQDHDEMLPFSWNLFNGSPTWWWTTVVHPYIRLGSQEDYNLATFAGCPSATWPGRLALAANPQVMLYVNGPFGYPSSTRPLATLDRPAETVLLADCSQVDAWQNAPMNFQPINRLFWLAPPFGAAWEQFDRDTKLTNWPPLDPAFGQIRYRHSGGANLAYLDGHVKWIPRGGVPSSRSPRSPTTASATDVAVAGHFVSACGRSPSEARAGAGSPAVERCPMNPAPGSFRSWHAPCIIPSSKGMQAVFARGRNGSPVMRRL